MRSGLAARVDRLAKLIAPTSAPMPKVIFAVFDRDESEIVGLNMLGGDTHFLRQAGETTDQLLERATAATGFGMWAADYGDIDRYDGVFAQPYAENRNADGPVE